MMATTTATVLYAMLWPDGHLDLPAEILDRLRIEGGWQCVVEVENDTITVRPAIAVPDEDLWAYTPENLAAVEAALAEDSTTLSPLSLADLERIIAEHDE
jgi:antitoxin component of MazEF toxin-antitoxin module